MSQIETHVKSSKITLQPHYWSITFSTFYRTCMKNGTLDQQSSVTESFRCSVFIAMDENGFTALVTKNSSGFTWNRGCTKTSHHTTVALEMIPAWTFKQLTRGRPRRRTWETHLLVGKSFWKSVSGNGWQLLFQASGSQIEKRYSEKLAYMFVCLYQG